MVEAQKSPKQRLSSLEELRCALLCKHTRRVLMDDEACDDEDVSECCGKRPGVSVRNLPTRRDMRHKNHFTSMILFLWS